MSSKVIGKIGILYICYVGSIYSESVYLLRLYIYILRLYTGEDVHGSKNVHETKNAEKHESEGDFQKLLAYVIHLGMSGAYEISG